MTSKKKTAHNSQRNRKKHMNEPSNNNNKDQTPLICQIISASLPFIVYGLLLFLITNSGPTSSNSSLGLSDILSNLSPWIMTIGVLITIGICCYFFIKTKDIVIRLIIVLLVLILAYASLLALMQDQPRFVDVENALILK